MRELWHQAAFRNAFLVRGTAAWAIVRVFMGAAELTDPNVVGEGVVLLFVGALVVWDARRRHEDLFLANLSVPAWAIGVVGALGALVLEVIVP